MGIASGTGCSRRRPTPVPGYVRKSDAVANTKNLAVKVEKRKNHEENGIKTFVARLSAAYGRLPVRPSVCYL